MVDASLVVEAVIGTGPARAWCQDLLEHEELAAPHFMLAEAANLLRRAALFRDVSVEQASQAHAELVALKVSLFPYLPYGARIWELRNNVSAYDAWYVALAEDLGVPLATLDGNLMRSPGPRCQFLTFPG